MKTLEFTNPKQAQKLFEVVSEFCDSSLTIEGGKCVVMFDAPTHNQPNTSWLHCFKGVVISYCEGVIGVRNKKGGKVFYIYDGKVQTERKGIPFKGFLPK